MNAIAGFSAAHAIGPATRGTFDALDRDGSGAIPIGLLVAEKMRELRQLRKLRTDPASVERHFG